MIPNFEREVNGTLFTFIYVTKGSCRFVMDDEILIANENQMLFIPTERTGKLVFENQKNKFCEGIYLHVRFFAGVNSWDYHTQIINPNDMLINLLVDVPKNNYPKRDYKLPRKDCTFIKKAYTFLEAVQDSMVKSNYRYSELIENAIEYMFNTTKYSIGDVARYCNISERYLSKIFKHNTGVSPVKMKQKIMAEKAEEFLKESTLSIDEIANQVGFDSTAHFRKVFESRFDIPPSKMRNRFKFDFE